MYFSLFLFIEHENSNFMPLILFKQLKLQNLFQNWLKLEPKPEPTLEKFLEPKPEPNS